MTLSRADLEHLITVVAQELTARPTESRCGCHAVLTACCPHQLRPALEAGATRLGVQATGGAPAVVASLIDHTLLRPDATRSDIEELCREAQTFRFATVCINPFWVPTAVRCLRGGQVAVCSVIGFPLGATTSDTKAYETRRALFDGAREIDMVINVGALRSGDVPSVARDIQAVTEVCHEGGAVSKVILETSLLTDEEKVTACTLAQSAGADFVKTSTGFGPGGATVADVALMRRVVGATMGVKAAGGVRDLRTAEALVAAGASRIGASAGVRIVQEAGDGRRGAGHER